MSASAPSATEADILDRQLPAILAGYRLGTPTNTVIKKIPECQKGSASVCGERCRQVERPQEIPVDDGMGAEQPERGAHLCAVSAAQPFPWQDRHPLPERRFRQKTI